MFLLKNIVAHRWRKVGVGLGASILCVVNPDPKKFMMRLNIN